MYPQVKQRHLVHGEQVPFFSVASMVTLGRKGDA